MVPASDHRRNCHGRSREQETGAAGLHGFRQPERGARLARLEHEIAADDLRPRGGVQEVDRLDDRRAAMSRIDAPERGKPVEDLLSLDRGEVHVLRGIFLELVQQILRRPC